MSDMIRDVDESLKKDRLHALWEEYGPTLIFSAIALVVMTALFSGWNAWQDSKNRMATEAVFSASASGNPSEKFAEVAGEYPDRLSGLSYLNAANAAFEAGETERALQNYKLLADEADADKVFKDLAQILYVNLSLDTASDMPVDAKDMQERLQPITENNSSPWQAFAILLQGAITAHLEGDMHKAAEILEALRENETAPVDVRAQAITLADFYRQAK